MPKLLEQLYIGVHTRVRLLTHRWYARRSPVRYARRIGVAVGAQCRFIGVSTATFGSEPYLISIGDHVTVTAGVQFITHDGGVWVFREREPDIEVFGRIVVEENVFIGFRAVIMPNVRIGAGSVIGAGAVVTRSVPRGIVVAGVPARAICTVEEYRRRIARRATHVRRMNPPDKRVWLEANVPEV